MALNRIRKYSRFLERKLHNHCRSHSRRHLLDVRGFRSNRAGTGRSHRSLSLSRRRDMDTILSRTPPLNVLIVPADAEPDIAPCLSALRAHWTLICPVAADVAEAARRFEPDVVLVDEQVTGLLSFPYELAGSGTGRNPIFVVMSRSGDRSRALPPGYTHCLPVPATAVELEQLLWQIRRSAIAQPPDRPGRPDKGMIG